MRRRLGYFFLRLLLSALVISVLVIATQPLQVFPGAFVRKGSDAPPPAGVEQTFLTTSDGVRLKVWRVGPERVSRGIAVVFNGNGGDLRNFFSYHQILASAGFTAYGLDYRGYGGSSGFPSEQGLYLDSDTLWEWVVAREGVRPAQIIPVGISLGTGVAARIAARAASQRVLLITPYTSLRDVASGLPFFGILSPFLWYEFPTARALQAMQGSCVVLLHGERDAVIPFSHSKRLAAQLTQQNQVRFVRSADAGHNDVFFRKHERVIEELLGCESSPVPFESESGPITP